MQQAKFIWRKKSFTQKVTDLSTYHHRWNRTFKKHYSESSVMALKAPLAIVHNIAYERISIDVLSFHDQ